MLNSKPVLIFSIAILLLFLADGVFAERPSIFHVLMEGTASVSEQDFKKANLALIEFAKVLLAKTRRIETGTSNDWLSVNYFGTDYDYNWHKQVSCADFIDMMRLATKLYNQKHPEFADNTAIYSAIGTAVNELRAFEKRLAVSADTYIKNIILLAVEQDRSIHANLIKNVKKTCPKTNDHFNLFIIGVGPYTDLSEFDALADMIWNINDFDELTNVLILLAGFM